MVTKPMIKPIKTMTDLCGSSAKVFPIVAPTSINPAFTPTRKSSSPTKANTNPVKSLRNCDLRSRKEVVCINNKIPMRGTIATILSLQYSGRMDVKTPTIVSDCSTFEERDPAKLLEPFNSPKIITDMTAPTEAIATNPKLSFSEALLSFFSIDMPTDKDKIKGTASMPVVEPEASREIARNSGEEKKASPKRRR